MTSGQDFGGEQNILIDRLFSPVKAKIWSLRDFMALPELTTNEPVVLGLLHREEFILCSATAKTGKTFLAMDLAIAVALGRPFLGHFETRPGKVLYVETELTKFFLRERFLQILGPSNLANLPINLFICKEALKIDTDFGKMELTKIINEFRPDLVIMDPFYRLHSKNEDKSQEITPILNLIKELAQQYKTAFFVLHHEGKKGEANGNQNSHRPRGSSAFADVPDAIISMTRDPEKKSCRRLSIEQRNFAGEKLLIKQKDDLSGWEVLESDQEKEHVGPYKIKDILRNGPLKRLDLLAKFEKETGLKERTCERKIADAIGLGLVRTEKEGIHTVYYINTPPPTVSPIEMSNVGGGE